MASQRVLLSVERKEFEECVSCFAATLLCCDVWSILCGMNMCNKNVRVCKLSNSCFFPVSEMSSFCLQHPKPNKVPMCVFTLWSAAFNVKTGFDSKRWALLSPYVTLNKNRWVWLVNNVTINNSGMMPKINPRYQLKSLSVAATPVGGLQHCGCPSLDLQMLVLLRRLSK